MKRIQFLKNLLVVPFLSLFPLRGFGKINQRNIEDQETLFLKTCLAFVDNPKIFETRSDCGPLLLTYSGTKKEIKRNVLRGFNVVSKCIDSAAFQSPLYFISFFILTNKYDRGFSDFRQKNPPIFHTMSGSLDEMREKFSKKLDAILSGDSPKPGEVRHLVNWSNGLL